MFKRRVQKQRDLAQMQSVEQWFDWIRMLDAEGYPPAFLQIGRFRLEFSRGSRKVGAVIADMRITEDEEEQ